MTRPSQQRNLLQTFSEVPAPLIPTSGERYYIGRLLMGSKPLVQAAGQHAHERNKVYDMVVFPFTGPFTIGANGITADDTEQTVKDVISSQATFMSSLSFKNVGPKLGEPTLKFPHLQVVRLTLYGLSGIDVQTSSQQARRDLQAAGIANKQRVRPYVETSLTGRIGPETALQLHQELQTVPSDVMRSMYLSAAHMLALP